MIGWDKHGQYHVAQYGLYCAATPEVPDWVESVVYILTHC